jgi:Xaa-Pro aminopeptidase
VLTIEHMSEYVGSYAQRLAWLTGFQARRDRPSCCRWRRDLRRALYHPGRQQVSPTEWSYQSVPETSVAKWLHDNAPNGARIGDPTAHR